eukprot:TRINITY_DN3389_c0_g1_i8.p1 TRINITY_DN3389_c0_g1~~TRINITY_DN3389_c0_g1_i8.p1  ORF type:complete len:265 (+),score=46.29 TRINITY_DN3389_c0_g1_i8:75-869(+)
MCIRDRWLDHMLKSDCCGNYVCHFCIRDLDLVLEKDTKKSPRCPNCGTDDPLFTDVAVDDEIKLYTDTPFAMTATIKGQSFFKTDKGDGEKEKVDFSKTLEEKLMKVASDRQSSGEVVEEREGEDEEDSVHKDPLSQTLKLGDGQKETHQVNFYNTTSFPGRVVKRSSFGGTLGPGSVRSGGGTANDDEEGGGSPSNNMRSDCEESEKVDNEGNYVVRPLEPDQVIVRPTSAGTVPGQSIEVEVDEGKSKHCLLYTSPSPRDQA